METTMQIPLGQQEHLKEFFQMMETAGREEQAKDIEEFLRYLQELKDGFSDALEEIDYLKGQIDDMKSRSLKGRLGKMQADVMEAFQQAKQVVEEVGNLVKEEISRSLEAGRKKGLQAAAALVDVSHVRQGLSKIEAGLVQSSVSLSGAALRTEDIAGEIHSAKEHVRAAGNIALGKMSSVYGEREAYQGILGKIQKSIEYCQKLMSGLISKTQKARAHMEHFYLTQRGTRPIPTIGEIEQEFHQSAGMENSLNKKVKEARQ